MPVLEFGGAERAPPPVEQDLSLQPDESAEAEQVRKLFPETWLWTISDSGYIYTNK